MVNQTFNKRKKTEYNFFNSYNDYEIRTIKNSETIRKSDSFDRRDTQDEKLNLIIDIPDRW